MTQTILITGATDGIGLLTAKQLAARGHKLLLHGRDDGKLDAAKQEVGNNAQTYRADFSSLSETSAMAKRVAAEHERIDVLINNAGVFKTPNPVLPGGLDARFVVNTLAPYVLTRALLRIIPKQGRVINLSSAAQAPVDIGAMHGKTALDDMDAYSQSKLAITIWSQHLAESLPEGPAVIAVNPGSLLASKMVKEGFGIDGKDPNIGADILCRLALDDAFAKSSGKYWDNDAGAFAKPHSAAQNPKHAREVVNTIAQLAGETGGL